MVAENHGHDHDECPGIDKHIYQVEALVKEKLVDGLTVAEVLDIAGQVLKLSGCIVEQFRSDDIAEFDAFASGVERVWKQRVTPIDLPINDAVEGMLVDPFLEQQVKPGLHLLRRQLLGK